jgi:hypothetical protein
VFICFLLALIGIFIKEKKDEQLKTDEVQDSITICRLLFERSKLTEQEYAFETEQVATAYNASAFTGYKFMAAPIISVVKRKSFLDHSLVFLVRRWIKVHRYFFENKNQKPPRFHILFTQSCIFIAKGTGKTLCLFIS